MSIAASIPPELFQYILTHVGDYQVLSLDPKLPKRKEMVRHLAACSLTCVYWAQVCRPKAFQCIWVRSFDDLQALMVLVLDVPGRFTPISRYIDYAHCVQLLDDRPWLHNLSLQRVRSVLLPYWLTSTLKFHLIGSSRPAQALSPLEDPGSSSRLFAGIPTTLPPKFHCCDVLAFENLHFRSLSDLRRALLHFSLDKSNDGVRWFYALSFKNVTLGSQFQVEDHFVDALFSNPHRLNLSAAISTSDCPQAALLVWASNIFRQEIQFRSLSTQQHGEETRASLHPSDSRNTFAVFAAIVRTLISAKTIDKPSIELRAQPIRSSATKHDVFFLVKVFKPSTSADQAAWLQPGKNNLVGDFLFDIGTAGSSPSTFTIGRRIYHVKSIIMHFTSTSVERFYPWSQLIDLFTNFERLQRVQLRFETRDSLVTLMETQRMVFDKLHDRIELWYRGRQSRDDHKFVRVNFVTLEESDVTWNDDYWPWFSS